MPSDCARTFVKLNIRIWVTVPAILAQIRIYMRLPWVCIGKPRESSSTIRFNFTIPVCMDSMLVGCKP